MCHEFSKIQDTALISDLKDKCDDLLKLTNSKVGNCMSDSLYNVRCLMVHRMYLLDHNMEKMLVIIDDLFLELCIKLLLTLKFP